MKQIKRILSLVLCILMLTSTVCLSYAADSDTAVWSDWTTDASNVGNDQYECESKTQISTRTKEEITSNSDTMPGWTRDDSKTTSEVVWSGNVQWYNSQRSTSETYRYTGSRSVYNGDITRLYRYYRYQNGYYDFLTYQAPGYQLDEFWVSAGSVYSYDVYQTGQDLYWSDEIQAGKYPCWKGETKASYITQYGYESGTKVYTYTFYRWTDWSAWTDGTGTDNESTQVRTVYRYRTHPWDNGAVLENATCIEAGLMKYTCTTDGCGATKTEPITIDPNNHVNTKNVNAVASTCKVKGYSAGVYCNDCQKYVSGHEEQPLDANNHVNTKNVNAVASTCKVKGYSAGVYCNDCQKYVSGHEEQPLDANNHVNTKNVNAVPSTCTVNGYSAGVYCDDCQKYVSGHQKQGLANHTITIINKKDATYDTEGYTGDEYCTVCKQTIKTGSAIPKLQRPQEPTQSGGRCKWCGKTHSGFFGWFVAIFHKILVFLFGAKY